MIRWQRVNSEPFEYAIQQGPHGDEFVKLLDGSCLRRGIRESEVTKQTLNALERVFAAEIENRLPFQSKAKVYQRLCEEGLVQPMERVFGGRFPITVEGWQLTHAGRFVYCNSCDP